MTIKDVMDYIYETPHNTNPTILYQKMVELMGSDNPDLSVITAGADKILEGYVSVDQEGHPVNGECAYNAEVPAEATPELDYGVAPGQYCLNFVDGAWILRKVGDSCVVDGKSYETIGDAFDDVESGAEIKLEHDAESQGLGLWENASKEISLDLNGHTLDVIGPAVGSQGTQTQAAHFEKGSKVVIKNGKICATDAALHNIKMGIQNYSDLVLEDVIVDFSDAPNVGYAVSNNFGSLTVKGNTQILAAAGKCAFDLWFGLNPQGAYDDGLNVTFDDSFTGRVVGNVEYGAQNASRVPEWKDRTKLVIKGNGTFEGPIVKSSNNFNLEDANIEVYGGTFSSESWNQFRK